MLQNDLFCPEPGCTKRFASSVTLEHHIARKHDDETYEEVSYFHKSLKISLPEIIFLLKLLLNNYFAMQSNI